MDTTCSIKHRIYFDNLVITQSSKEFTIETDPAPNLPTLPLNIKQTGENLIRLLDNAIQFDYPGWR